MSNIFPNYERFHISLLHFPFTYHISFWQEHWVVEGNIETAAKSIL